MQVFEGPWLAGIVSEDYPEWGEPNLCVCTLRTLDQTLRVGMRRAEHLGERGGHARVQTCWVCVWP